MKDYYFFAKILYRGVTVSGKNDAIVIFYIFFLSLHGRFRLSSADFLVISTRLQTYTTDNLLFSSFRESAVLLELSIKDNS